MVRSGRLPLAQTINRIHELETDPAPVSNTTGILKFNAPDNVYILRDGRCVEIRHPVTTHTDGTKQYMCEVYEGTEAAFLEPCNSSIVNIYICRNENPRRLAQIIPVNDFLRKAI